MLFIASALCFGFTNCGDDDDDENDEISLPNQETTSNHQEENHSTNPTNNNPSSNSANGITYKYDASNKKLIVSGNGAIPDYCLSTFPCEEIKQQPWKDLDVEKLIVQGDITEIGNGAFRYLNIKEISLQPSIKRIGASAFANTPIERITIPSNVVTIGTAAFYGCANLISVTFDQNGSLEYIGEQAFNNCLKLNLGCFIVPSNVKTIDKAAFRGCILNDIILNEKLETIGDGAFVGSVSTKKLIFTNSVKTIGEDAFISNSISEIRLGTDITYIGKICVAKSGSMYINKSIPPTVTSIDILQSCSDLSYCKNKWTLYVPKGSKELYSKTKLWKEFRTIIEDENL